MAAVVMLLMIRLMTDDYEYARDSVNYQHEGHATIARALAGAQVHELLPETLKP